MDDDDDDDDFLMMMMMMMVVAVMMMMIMMAGQKTKACSARSGFMQTCWIENDVVLVRAGGRPNRHSQANTIFKVPGKGGVRGSS